MAIRVFGNAGSIQRASGMQKKSMWDAAALLGATATAVLMLTGGGNPSAAQPTGDDRYTTVPVTVQSSKPTAVIGATVIPFKEVTLSAQIPGVVEFIAGKEGTEVEAGKVLLHVNDDELRSQRKAAVAQFMSAQAALRNAQVQYGREIYSPQVNRGMGGMGIPSMFDRMFTRPMENMMGQTDTGASRYADLHRQQSGVSQAMSAIQAARAKIDAIDAKIRDASLRAPFKGTIIQKMVEKGDTVQPGRPLIKFGQVDHWQVQAEVPVRLVRNLFVGQKIKTKLDSMPTMVDAYVRQIYPTADLQRHTVTVKFDLPRTMRASPGAPETRIPGGPGQYAEVHIPDSQSYASETISVPKNAIVRRGSLPGVYVARPNGGWGLAVRNMNLGILICRGPCALRQGRLKHAFLGGRGNMPRFIFLTANPMPVRRFPCPRTPLFVGAACRACMLHGQMAAGDFAWFASARKRLMAAYRSSLA